MQKYKIPLILFIKIIHRTR